MFVKKGKHTKQFFLCYIMKNIQENLKRIWQLPISREPPILVKPLIYDGGGGGGVRTMVHCITPLTPDEVLKELFSIKKTLQKI